MAKEKVVERNDRPGAEVLRESGSSDGSALKSGDPGGPLLSSALVSGKKQDDLSLARVAPVDVTDRLFDTVVDLSIGIMGQYDEQYGHAMAMYRHYSEAAVNGSEVDVGGMLTADEMAIRWLEESRRITEDKKKYLETLLVQANRSKIEREKMAAALEKEKMKTSSGPKNVTNTQNNTLIIGENNRDRIRKLEEMTGGVSGSDDLPELQVVATDSFNGVLPADYQVPVKDKDKASDASKDKRSDDDDDEDSWIHDDDGGEQSK